MVDMTIDADAVEIGTDLEPVDHAQPTTLFRTDDPLEVVERASRVADALKGVLDKQGLTKQISGRKHVLVEGWCTLGSMLGVVPVVEWTRKLDDGWEARVEARTLDGRVIGAAEAQCLRGEKTWKSRDDYALRSMAQTRATSKALRGPLGFIVTLAGYEGTPADEMPDSGSGAASVPSSSGTDPAPEPLSPDQYTAIVQAFKDAGNPTARFGDWLGYPVANAQTISEGVRQLSAERADEAITFLRGLTA